MAWNSASPLPRPRWRIPAPVRAVGPLIMLLAVAASAGCFESRDEIVGVREAVDPTPELWYTYSPDRQGPVA